MSIWDNVKKFAQPYADDDYEDYDDEDEYLDDYEEAPAPARRNPFRRNPVAAAPVEEDDADDDFGFGVTAAPAAAAAPAAPAANTGFNGHVVNMHTGPKQEVVLFRPISFNDTARAADDLCNNKAVVLNLENVEKSLSLRVVDFLSGCVYAVNGSVKKIAQSAYLFCPRNMDVKGDLESLQAEAESYI